MKIIIDVSDVLVKYHYLNLPRQITQNSVATNYTYRADGVKVKKIFGDVETHYLDGFQYKYTYSWEDPNGTMVNDEMKLRIIPTAEGYYDYLKTSIFINTKIIWVMSVLAMEETAQVLLKL